MVCIPNTQSCSNRCPLMQFLVLHLLSASLAILTVLPGGFCQEWTAEAGLLVLDVQSLWFKERDAYTLQYTAYTDVDCKAKCRSLPGCATYAFCSNPKGCGYGCQKHLAKNPPLNPEDDSPGGNPLHAKLPVLSFGPFPLEKDFCSQDRWPYGMCVLKRTKPLPLPVNALTRAVGNASALDTASLGWLTGQPPELPPACEGVSGAICAMCNATAAPATCFSCVRDPRVAGQLTSIALLADGVAAGSSGNMQLDQCATCANLASEEDRQKCMSCVLDKSTCEECINHPAAKQQIPLAATRACMDCATTRGRRFLPTCHTCALAPDPTSCNACLSTFYPRTICRSSSYVNCYKPDFDNPCARCQAVAQGSQQLQAACLECYATPNRRQDCDSCGSLASPEEQQACYACAAKVPQQDSQMSSCALCFNSMAPGPARQQCLACVMNPATPLAARKTCAMCSGADSGGMGAEQQGRCLRCVSSPDGGDACYRCAQGTSSQPAFGQCMACYKDSANCLDCAECSALGSDADQGSCYQCVISSKLVLPEDAPYTPLGTCADCFDLTVDKAVCMQCNLDPTISTAAKSWCTGCAAQPAAKRSTCLACLRSKADAHAYGSLCGL